MFVIENYIKPNGSVPLEEYLDGLELKVRIKVMANIELLRVEGSMLRQPYTEHLMDGIFELRTRLGTNTERVLFFFMDGRRVVLTHGFTKKTRKIPPNEIAKAKSYRKDYLSQRES